MMNTSAKKPLPTLDQRLKNQFAPQIETTFIERHCSNFTLQLNSHDCTISFLNRTSTEMEVIKITTGFSALKVLTEYLQATVEAIEKSRGTIKVLKGSHPNEEFKQSLDKTMEEFALEE